MYNRIHLCWKMEYHICIYAYHNWGEFLRDTRNTTQVFQVLVSISCTHNADTKLRPDRVYELWWIQNQGCCALLRFLSALHSSFWAEVTLLYKAKPTMLRGDSLQALTYCCHLLENSHHPQITMSYHQQSQWRWPWLSIVLVFSYSRVTEQPLNLVRRRSL